jgi:hypothetical protein
MRQRKRRVLAYAWCNPRLPLELLSMVNDGERRRTIGEPERLSKQMHIMFESRNLFVNLREQVRTREKFLVRRRSYDLGEHKDGDQQVDETLGKSIRLTGRYSSKVVHTGYQFDQPFVLQTIGQLKRDSTFMSARMAGGEEGRDNSDSEEDVGLNVDDIVGLHVDEAMIEREQRKLTSKLKGFAGSGANDDDPSVSSIATSVPSAAGAAGVTLSRSLKMRSTKQRNVQRAQDKEAAAVVATARSNVSALSMSTSSATVSSVKVAMRNDTVTRPAAAATDARSALQKSSKGTLRPFSDTYTV